jgi:ATP-dependent DNA helicase RecG
MLLRSLTAPVKSIFKIRPGEYSSLLKLGIQTVSDLLLHYPRDWENRKKYNPINGFRNDMVCTVVTVMSHKWVGYGSNKLLKIYVEDDTGRASLVCYKRPRLASMLIIGERYNLWGRFEYKYGEIQTGSFQFEPVDRGEFFNRILPVYRLTSGITQDKLRKFISSAIEKFAGDLENELPDEIIERDNLLPKSLALKAIHFPSSADELEIAKNTLIYEELFYLEIMVCKRAIERKGYSLKNKQEDKIAVLQYTPLQKRLVERLPFSLTQGQKNAIDEINADISSSLSMARLLQGDVGSGKTLVSFMAALRAVENGGQAAIMAPTELLARQHAENAARLLEPLGLTIAFLTGNIKAAGRKELVKNLTDDTIDIVVGTHALFSGDVKYKNLKLAVIDEQHRFGVTQRSLIMEKGDNPDLLMMSATPIPRTLAFTVFGDMDISTIKDMPPGRKPVKTHLAKLSSGTRVYDFIRDELDKGRQAYFVYPLIDCGENLKDAVSMAEKLSKEIFPNFRTALIHSKLNEDEKRQTMDEFKKGEIKILAATSVVEVGVDVPNATCMVIENAERFGLSALHQLRGRVGRGQEQSFCFLIYSEELTDEGKTRLKVMLENSDGFIIAEEDLKLRGPGLITGTEQSGYLVLGIANPIRDMKLLEKARTDAFSILEGDPNLLLSGNRIIARVLDTAPPFGEITL